MFKRILFLSLATIVVSSVQVPASIAAADDSQGVAINAVLLNKTSVKTGDSIGAEIFWKAGDVKGRSSDLSLNVTVTDKENRLCAAPVVQAGPFEDGMAEMRMTASSDCDTLRARAVLLDKKGKIVSSKFVAAPSATLAPETAGSEQKPAQEAPVADTWNLFWRAGVIIIAALASLSLIAILVVKIRRKRMAAKVFFAIIAVSSILSLGYVAKAQFDLVFPEMDAVLLDKSSYAAGETATISVQAWGCAWDWQEYPQNVDVAVSLGGSGFVQIVGPQESYRMSRPSNLTCNPPTATKSFTVPSAAGIYNLVVRTAVDAGIAPYPWVYTMVGPSFDLASVLDLTSTPTYTVSGGYVYYNFPITVTAGSSIINGACGASNGGSYPTAPATDLCLSGTPSYVYDYGFWSWQCTGSGGGTTADCSATKPVPAVPVVDFKVNGSDGPITLAQGSTKNLAWTVTNATSCTASSSDGFTGSKVIPSGSEILSVNRVSTDTLTCTGPGGTSSDSVVINATCTPTTGSWGSCDCATEQKTRTNTDASCGTWTESDACTADEKNACRDFNWKEVAP